MTIGAPMFNRFVPVLPNGLAPPTLVTTGLPEP